MEWWPSICFSLFFWCFYVAAQYDKFLADQSAMQSGSNLATVFGALLGVVLLILLAIALLVLYHRFKPEWLAKTWGTPLEERPNSTGDLMQDTRRQASQVGYVNQPPLEQDVEHYEAPLENTPLAGYALNPVSSSLPESEILSSTQDTRRALASLTEEIQLPLGEDIEPYQAVPWVSSHNGYVSSPVSGHPSDGEGTSGIPNRAGPVQHAPGTGRSPHGLSVDDMLKPQRRSACAADYDTPDEGPAQKLPLSSTSFCARQIPEESGGAYQSIEMLAVRQGEDVYQEAIFNQEEEQHYQPLASLTN